MSPETAERSLLALLSLCQTEGFERLHLKFAGGEPSLNTPAIARACAFISESAESFGVRVSFNILTNGAFNDPTLVDLLAAHRISVSISVDGAPRIHDSFRFISRQGAREGSWRIVEGNIKRLVAAGIRPYILCTLTERTLDGLEEFVGFCLDNRLGFRLSPIRDRHTHMVPGMQDRMASRLADVYRWIGDTYPVSMPIEPYARFAEWKLSKPKPTACSSCRSMVAIGHTGAVASCQMRLASPAGSVFDGGSALGAFRSIRESPDNEFIVHPEHRTSGCMECPWQLVCAAGCPEHRRAVFGTTDTVSPWCDLFGTFLPHYVRAVATQIKRGVDRRMTGALTLRT